MDPVKLRACHCLAVAVRCLNVMRPLLHAMMVGTPSGERRKRCEVQLMLHSPRDLVPTVIDSSR